MAGCGNLTAGGLTGEATVIVSGDAPDLLSAVGRSLAQRAPVLSSASEDELEGRIEVEFLVFLEAANGSSVALSDDEIRARVDMRGRQDADVVTRIVPATLYTELRIVFTEIKAEVDSGLVIDGVTVLGEIKVELDDPTLTVSRALDLDVPDGGSVELLIDLNATAWLGSADPDLRTVAEDIFGSAVSVVGR
jgi:hypothetical protein